MTSDDVDAYVAALVEDCDDDDERLVRSAAQRLDDHATLMAAVEQVRDEAAMRLRAVGVPMTRISRLARLSDSHLARRLFRLGAQRKVVRT